MALKLLFWLKTMWSLPPFRLPSFSDTLPFRSWLSQAIDNSCFPPALCMFFSPIGRPNAFVCWRHLDRVLSGKREDGNFLLVFVLSWRSSIPPLLVSQIGDNPIFSPIWTATGYLIHTLSSCHVFYINVRHTHTHTHTLSLSLSLMLVCKVTGQSPEFKHILLSL